MFTHLHCHTEFSLLDGLAKIPRLVERAKALGMESLAITDHGAMYGVVEFYEECRKAGIKPIIGVEAYVARHGHRNKSSTQREYNHLILLCKDEVGYRNLIKLTTIAYTDGFYYKPRIDRALLEEYHEGLICLSGCASGELAEALLEDDWDRAREVVTWHRDLFGDDYYIELQEHGIAEHTGLAQKTLQVAREFGIPVVATGDCHYVTHDDHEAHDLLLCIQSQSTIQDESRWRLGADDFFLKSEEEMIAVFADVPEAISNTALVADKCNLTLDFGRVLLPQIADIPAGMTPDDYLAQLCWTGLEERYGDALTEAHRERLAMELDVIRQTGFANYFLVVWDFVAFARSRDIVFGVRGSAAGSIVLYCLAITDIDPIEYGLVFERFLNIERKEMPDIDMDFADDRRDEMIRYVTQKYGADHVAQIITFGTLGAKAAIRDVGRALAIPLTEVNRVAAMIPAMPGMSFERAFQENADFLKAYEADPVVKRLVDAARPLEGMARHASTHAAGVVISRDPLTDHVPLQRTSRTGEEGEAGRMVQFDMNTVAKVGLLKMDFLGLINLTILDRARGLVQQRHGVTLDLASLPLDDAKTYELLGSGQTIGVFQLEGTGMRRYIKDLKPTTFRDIAAMVALYRPGPMQHIPRFIDSKHGKTPITYPHPDLENILQETYGVIVYQDQVLFIARQFAGYSLGQADIFRKAMGKKIAEKMAEQREQFIAGAMDRGYDKPTATAIFELIEPFAGYAFNKAHSVCYAMVAYQTAYLKANYPAEYMSSLLTMYASVEDKVQSAIAEAVRLGLPVLPPDINQSRVEWSIEDREEGPAIRCGFVSIKNVGSAAMAAVVAERDANGPFLSVEDFCRRADLRALNKRALECLIKVGCFDTLGSRETLLANIDRLMQVGQAEARARESGQVSMFGMLAESAPVAVPSLMLDRTEPENTDQRLAWEKELLGVYLRNHPFQRYAEAAARDATTYCGQVTEDLAGQTLVLVGMVSGVRAMTSRSNGRPWAAVTIEDLDGSCELTVWNKVYEGTRDLWKDGAVVKVRAKLESRNDRLNLIVDDARLYVPSDEYVDMEPPLPAERDDGDWSWGEPPTVDAGSLAWEASAPLLEEPAAVRRAAAAVMPSATVTAVLPESAGVLGQAFPVMTTRSMVITLSATGDRQEDLVLLNRLLDTLRAFPGEDRVQVIIERPEKVQTFELPDVAVEPVLQARLEAVLGPAAAVRA